MNLQVLKKHSRLIAAIAFTLIALCGLLSYRYNLLLMLLIVIPNVALAIVLFIKKDKNVITLFVTIHAILSFIVVMYMLISYKVCFVYSYSYEWDSNEYSFNIFCLIPFLLFIFSSIFIVCLYVANIIENDLSYGELSEPFASLYNHRESINKIWFLPGVIIVISLALGIILNLVLNNLYLSWIGSYYFYGSNIVSLLSLCVGLLSLGLYAIPLEENMVNVPRNDYKPDNNYVSNSEMNMRKCSYYGIGHFNLVGHFLLLIFSFGIWNLIWIYRTTKYLNNLNTRPEFNPVTKLLLCIFIPFYYIYWVYKNAVRTDELAQQCGISSNIAVLSLVLTFFIPIIPPIIIQDKINDISYVINNR